MRKRILVVQPELSNLMGGGGGVCAWILEALHREHDVSLLTWKRPDFAAINRFYGTELSSGTVRVEEALPMLPARLRPPRHGRRLAHSLLLRAARQHRGSVDLIIAAEEESDLGGGGMQYIHFPWHRPPGPGLVGAGVRAYHALVAFGTGSSAARMRRNLTLVNSDWTGAHVRARYGIETVTVYPPAVGPFPRVPWSERSDGFIAIGRLAPAKRFELLIDIVESVRARGHATTLRIVGTPHDAAYEARLARYARGRPWVAIDLNLARDELVPALGQRRYGLHGKADEHFGMAVAEMASAGAIPFVPDGGGQVEIVGDPRLRWRTQDEAVAKIVAVLEQPALQQELRRGLDERIALFTPERFVERIRALVRGMTQSARAA